MSFKVLNVLLINTVLSLLGIINTANAGIITYDSEVDFINATSTSLIENFESWSNGSNSNITTNQISYTGNLYICSALCNNYVMGQPFSKTLTSNGNEDFTLTFTGGVTELGFNTYVNQYGPGVVELFDISGGLFQTLLVSHEPSIMGFLGVVSEQLISAFRWTSSSGKIINTGVDNIRTNAVNSINEPNNVLIIMILAVFCIVVHQRKIAKK